MLDQLGMILEVLSVIVCLHRMYQRKIRADIRTIALAVGCAAVFIVVNECSLNPEWTIIAYGLTIGYCIRQFGDRFFGGVRSTFMILIFLSVIEFLYTLPVDLLTGMQRPPRAVITNVLVLVSCAWILPKCVFSVLFELSRKKKRFFLTITGFVLGIILVLQYQQRILKEMYSDMFIFAVPAIPLLIWGAGKLGVLQKKNQEMEKELNITYSMERKYEELMKTVRLRQHGYKNHLAAILSTHATCKSYDKLVKAQREYCGSMIQENKYNDLPSLGDRVFTGFLYGKFQTMEEQGVRLKYEISGKLHPGAAPVYYLIEVTGILLDNAAEAVKMGEHDERKGAIFFCFYETADRYGLSVRNPWPYVTYCEIESWFQMGKSTKGEDRGSGLYYVRYLCEQKNWSIICRNRQIEEENWIEFILEFGKADKV